MVLDVCIPTDSETLISSKLISCAGGGSSLKTKVYSTMDCTGDYEENFDEIDEDTCYEVVCEFESGTFRKSVLLSVFVMAFSFTMT